MRHYDQMVWAGAKPPHVNMSTKCEVVNSWELRGGLLEGVQPFPFWEPDADILARVAEPYINKEVVIPDTEALHGAVEKNFASHDKEEREEIFFEALQTYYMGFKNAVSPGTLVVQYNQPTTWASDGFHIGTYIKDTDTVESYLDRVDKRLEYRDIRPNTPVFMVTSMVIFGRRGGPSDKVAPFDVWGPVMDGLTQRPFAGIIQWYRKAKDLQIEWQGAAEQHYEKMEQMVDESMR